MKSEVCRRHSKPILPKLCEDQSELPRTAGSTDSIDQSSDNDGETVRDDQAIAVIPDPTLKVAICDAVVSNWSGELVHAIATFGVSDGSQLARRQRNALLRWPIGPARLGSEMRVNSK